jgi:hypothetical protein
MLQVSVEKALDFWTDLMSAVDEQQKGELMRFNGLKLQQIKQVSDAPLTVIWHILPVIVNSYIAAASVIICFLLPCVS